MSTTKTLLGIVLAALSASWLATGCVRMDPPTFICASSADCEGGEKCVNLECHSKDYCSYNGDCATGQRCSDSHCRAAVCTEQNAATACRGFACYPDESACKGWCTTHTDCASSFHCAFSSGKCLAGAPVANGGACTANDDCTSRACCPKGGGSVCAKSCSLSGETCTSATDCLSGFCCAFGGQSSCSAQACPPPPECTTDAQCSFGRVCESQKCVAPPALPKEPGETCSLGTECSSGTCTEGKCRGLAGKGQSCAQDYNCATGRKCCRQPVTQDLLCGDLNRGCSGTIGDKCDFYSDCLEGTCNDSSFCSKPCTSNAECGVSPWGVANACETNGLGEMICFPGCTSTTQCTQNIGYDVSCYEAIDSSASICAAG